jgi:hypothetical protein
MTEVRMSPVEAISSPVRLTTIPAVPAIVLPAHG